MRFRLNMKPTSVIEANLGLNPDGKVQKEWTHICRLHMHKYVPMRRGSLAVNVEEHKKCVVYTMPYAHYIYEGVLYVDPETGSPYAPKGTKKIKAEPERLLTISQEKHPFATRHWDKVMWSAEKDDCIKEIQDFVDRGGK